jgi:hypothetical protein
MWYGDISQDIDEALLWFCFEVNDNFTRYKVKEIVYTRLEQYKTKKLISNYTVRCDEINNTYTVIDDNRLKVSIILVKTGEEGYFATELDKTLSFTGVKTTVTTYAAG